MLVAFVAGVDPGDLVGGDELGVDGPVHEGGAGVAGPEGAVAVEYGDLGVEGVDAGVEVGGGEAEGRCGRTREAPSARWAAGFILCEARGRRGMEEGGVSAGPSGRSGGGEVGPVDSGRRCWPGGEWRCASR